MTSPRARDYGPVLVFASDAGGHRGEFVLWLAQAWLSDAPAVPLIVAGPSALRRDTAELDSLIRNGQLGWIEIQEIAAGASPRHHASALVSAVRESQPCRVLAMDLEPLLDPRASALQRLIGLRLSGIMLRPALHYSILGSPSPTLKASVARRLKAAFSRRALQKRSADTVFSLDPTAVAALQALAPRATVIALPDPVPPVPPGALSATEAREWAGVSPDRHLALLAGRLDARKNPTHLLDALLRIRPTTAERLAVVLAGPVPDADRPALLDAISRVRTRTAAHIYLHDAFVPDAHLAGLVDAADTVLLTYDRHVGSSGFLMRAAGAGTPVLAQDYGLVGHLVRENSLGQTVDATSASAIADGMDRAVEVPATGFDRDAADAFAQAHSVEAFGRTIVSHLAS